MKSKKCQDDALRIIHFLSNNQDRKSTMKHFEDEGVNKRTIQRVLKRYADSTVKLVTRRNQVHNQLY